MTLGTFGLSLLLALSGLVEAARPHLELGAKNEMRAPSEYFDGTYSSTYFDKGHFIAWRSHGSPQEPSIWIANAQTGKRVSAIAWLQGADDVRVAAAAVTPGGTLIARVGAVKADGTTSGGIGWFSEDGNLTHFVRTDDFAGHRICAQDEDSVWVFGFGRSSDGKKLKDYHLLRRYSKTNGLVESLIRRTALPIGLDFPASGTFETQLRCTSDRVVLYLGAGLGMYEYFIPTKSLQRWELLPLGHFAAYRGFAVTEEGDILIGLLQIIERGRSGYTGLYRMARGAGNQAQWELIKGSYTGQPSLDRNGFFALLGADKDGIVFRPAPYPDRTAIRWQLIGSKQQSSTTSIQR